MASWPQTPLTALLGITYPIVQAPMASAATPALAAAVANAGGLGSLGFGTSGPDQCRAEIGALRAATNRPFNVNFFVHAAPADDPTRRARMQAGLARYYAELGVEPDASAPPPPFDHAMLEVVLSERPAVVSFHFGLPTPARLRAVKDAGAIVLSSATTVAEARWLEVEGADVVIAQGYEAGGHRGTFRSDFGGAQIGTMALVPQVVEAVRCPVIAAGGIMDGRGIAAALMLGAAGAQLGTAFLGCPETRIHPLHRDALGASTDESAQMTRLFTGRPARALANRLVREMADAEADALDFPLQRGLTVPLGQAAAQRGSADFLSLWAGQGAPLLRRLPATALVETLIEEVEQALAR
ncbi:MAG TPA: nitronate monooxygenase [Geminicoccaceae bacterium]|nr:nitronate monooxygenase [Geminicoccaceae bacterium]